MAEYCTVAEIARWGVSAEALDGIPAKPETETSGGINQRDAILGASDVIDGYLRSRFTLPLTAWEQDLRRACAVIAAWDLISVRGYSPDDDPALKARYDAIIKWLEGVAAGKITPSVTDSSPGAEPGSPSGGPRVISSTSRGWSVRGTGRARGPFQSD